MENAFSGSTFVREALSHHLSSFTHMDPWSRKCRCSDGTCIEESNSKFPGLEAEMCKLMVSYLIEKEG